MAALRQNSGENSFFLRFYYSESDTENLAHGKISPFLKRNHLPNTTIYRFQPFIFGVLPCLGQTHDSYPVRLRLNPAQSDPDPDLLQTGHEVCALGYSFLTVRPVKDVGYFKRNQNIQCICGCFCVFKLPHPHHPVQKKR